MSAITEVYDASTALQAPPAVDSGEYIKSLRDSAGFIVGTVDKIAQKFFHVSLIEQCVEPFAGDWTQLQTAQGGWTNMAAALQASAKNYDAAAQQLQSVWEGAAAAQSQHRLLDVAVLHRDQAEGCNTVAEQLSSVIDIAKATGELVASTLSILNDFLMKIATQALVPVIGWFGAAFNIAAHAGKFWRLVNKITTAISMLIKVVGKVMRVIAFVQRIFGTANKFLGYGTQTITAEGNRRYLDDAARVQFGVG